MILNEQRDKELEALRAKQNFGMGLIASIIVGLIGAGLWAAITIATEYQIGYMALAIGAGVGFSMRYFGKGIDQKFGIAGALIAIISCILGNVFTLIALVASEGGVSFFEAASAIDYTLLPTIMMETGSPIDLLFFGIAAFEGYKFSFVPTEEKVEEQQLGEPKE